MSTLNRFKKKREARIVTNKLSSWMSNRDDRRDDSFDGLANTHREHYMLLLKSARRCAYDLNHCAGLLGLYASKQFKASREDDINFFYARYEMWNELFSPDGIKRYRHSLHETISAKECEIDRLKKIIIDAGIEYVDPDSIPF